MIHHVLLSRHKSSRRLSDEYDDARVGGVQSSFADRLLTVRKQKAQVIGKTRQNVGEETFRPAKDYVAHGGVACGLGLLLPSPVGVGIARCRITALKFSSCAEGIQVSRGDR